LNDLLAAVYLIFFALIAGGAFALMSQNLRRSASLTSAQRASKPKRHPEAPEPGDEILYVDLSRERLEELYQGHRESSAGYSMRRPEPCWWSSPG
jgi:hypothetical protein